MNENFDSRKSAALKRLAERLTVFNLEDRVISPTESDMLSLVVSGTLNGEKLAQRFPDFYEKMLENAGLRQAFLDALESLEAERDGNLIPMPAPDTRLDFLTSQPPAPNVIHLDEKNWRVLWQRPLAQIQAIFSPPELAYRAKQSLIEEPWVMLLREDIRVSGDTYSVALDCTPADEEENALAVFISLAVTSGASREPAKFRLRARLAWGRYQEDVLIPAEGRMRFPNISFDKIFDPATESLTDGLSLTLETAS